MENKVFILSTGRAGTNYLSNKIDDLKLSKDHLHQIKGSRRMNILSNLALRYPTFQNIVIKKLEDNPRELDNFIDPLKSVAFYFYLNKMKQGFPADYEKFKVIHLIRDPRDFVRSFMNWKNRKLSGKIAHHLIPYWMPKPKNQPIKNIWMSKFEHYCWTWKIKNELFLNNFKGAKNYHLVRFEDMTTDDAVLIELLNKLFDGNITKDEFEINNSIQKNSTVNKDFPHWKEWDIEMCQKLHAICGDLMKEFNYGTESEWLQKIHNEK